MVSVKLWYTKVLEFPKICLFPTFFLNPSAPSILHLCTSSTTSIPVSVTMAAAQTSNPMRDLELAKKAYDNNDIEASKQAHAAKHVEDHSKVGGHIKSIVFGGLDGKTDSLARPTSLPPTH